MTIDEKLESLGLRLPPPPKPVALYVPAVLTGNLLITSGILPFRDGAPVFAGCLGRSVSIEQGQEAARVALLNALSTIRQELGGLDRVERVVKLTGYVASAPEFTQQPAVLNGASELLISIFGPAGSHARAAVGASSLPLDSCIEIELTVQVRA
jgi:enamine deaminase RidA (YjgF/YER057c/UK114 family)